jgi:hypothetical protein
MTLTALLVLTYFGRYSIGRLVYFSLGAILSLGPAELTISKVYYICLLSFFSLKSLNSLKLEAKTPKIILNRVRNLSLTIILLLFINFLTSVLMNYSLIQIIRGQTSLFIFLLGIPIAVWSGRNVVTENIIDYAVVLGVFSALSFWFVWSQNRGLVDFQSSRFALASEWTAFLCLAIAFTSDKLNRLRSLTYALGSLLVVILMIASLTRTNILLCFWIIVVSILGKSSKLLAMLKFSLLTSVGFLSLAFAAPGFLSSDAFVRRINESWMKFSSGGFSSSGLGSDASVILRQTQSKLASDIFNQNPVFGSGQLPSGQTFDTIVASLAQYGVVGAILFTIVLYQIFRIAVSPLNRNIHLALPFFSTLLPASLIYNWIGGRSIWIAFIIILAISLSQEKRVYPN